MRLSFDDMRIIRADNDGEQQKRNVTPLPNRDISTSQQVATLLAAANSMAGVLASVREGGKEDGGYKDGGVQSSVETTLIQTCARLDSILTDDRNWSQDKLGKLEDLLTKVYEKHATLLDEQTVCARKTAAPHMRLSPVLLRISDDTWAAVLGDAKTPSSIIGIGPSVEAALESFDRLANGERCPVKEQWIKNNAAQYLNEKHEHQTAAHLDGQGSRNTEVATSDQHHGGTGVAIKQKRKVGRTKARQATRRRRGGKVKPDQKG